MYVYTDGAICNDHPIRRSVYTAFGYLMVHLPMSAGLLIGGHVSASSTEEELTSGRRWLWGGGLGVGMLFMWIYAQLYRDCDAPGTLVFSKVRLSHGISSQGVMLNLLTLSSQQVRLFPRLLAAAVYALLPLTSEEQLGATALVSTGAGISVFVVIWETVSSLESGCAKVVESWKGRVDDLPMLVQTPSRKARPPNVVPMVEKSESGDGSV